MKQASKTNLLAALLGIILLLLVLCLLCSVLLLILHLTVPSVPEDTGKGSLPEDTTPSSQPTITKPEELTLAETPDAGWSYLSRLIFYGESTTAHLSRNGGVLDGSDEERRMVWKDEDTGTFTLDDETINNLIHYHPKDGSAAVKITLSEALQREQPEFLVLNIGINGLVYFHGHKAAYLRDYNALIDGIRKVSPGTKIILQTIYPVGDNQPFTDDKETANAYIRTLNGWLSEIAAAHKDVRIADTASVLTDDAGNLLEEFDNGDGYHLTNAAYEEILLYLRRHAWQ